MSTRAAHFGAVIFALGAIALGASCGKSNDGGPQPTLDRAALLDPQTCTQCHADHNADWSGSMHAYASDDPVFRAMNKRGQRETNGALGTFCVNCHAPMAVREGATTDGLNLDQVPQKLRGVTCFFCHSVDAVNGTHNDPLDVSGDLVMRGPFADPVANTGHRAAYSPLHDRTRVESASLCGACHDIQTGHGANIERTFDEWQKSVFSRVPIGRTCAQCHMHEGGLQPIATYPGVFSRKPHAHTFAAVDTALTSFPSADVQKAAVKAFLDTELQSALCVSAVGQPQIRVVIDNVAGGHSFPSGSAQDRRLWIEVIAYSGANVVYQSGVVADGASPASSTNDPDLWLMRDCMFDDSGKQVSMFWNAASYESNTLPGQATFDQLDPRYYQTHVVQSFPRGNQTIQATVDKVTMRVRLQPVGLDVLDDLVASGDLDPQVRATMTTLDVGAPLSWTKDTATDQYLEDRTPFSCITTTNLNVQADKVPAVDHQRCKP